jgi:hypothetical protein
MYSARAHIWRRTAHICTRVGVTTVTRFEHMYAISPRWHAPQMCAFPAQCVGRTYARRNTSVRCPLPALIRQAYVRHGCIPDVHGPHMYATDSFCGIPNISHPSGVHMLNDIRGAHMYAHVIVLWHTYVDLRRTSARRWRALGLGLGLGLGLSGVPSQPSYGKHMCATGAFQMCMARTCTPRTRFAASPTSPTPAAYICCMIFVARTCTPT